MNRVERSLGALRRTGRRDRSGDAGNDSRLMAGDEFGPCRLVAGARGLDEIAVTRNRDQFRHRLLTSSRVAEIDSARHPFYCTDRHHHEGSRGN